MSKTVADLVNDGFSDLNDQSPFDQLDEILRDHLIEVVYMTYAHRWSNLAVAYLRRWDQSELEQLLEHLAGLDD